MPAAPPDRPETLCRPCRGSGVCVRCDAAGLVRAAGQRVKCLACKGSTVCHECRGRGWVQLPPVPPPPGG